MRHEYMFASMVLAVLAAGVFVALDRVNRPEAAWPPAQAPTNTGRDNRCGLEHTPREAVLFQEFHDARISIGPERAAA